MHNEQFNPKSSKLFPPTAAKLKQLYADITGNSGAAIRTALRYTAVAFVSILFAAAELTEGIHPFGIALFCAMEAYPALSFAGLILGALIGTENPLVYMAIYAALFSVRMLLSRGTAKFYRPLSIRCVLSSAGAVAAGAFTIVEGGFLYYDLIGMIAAAILAPLFTYAYSEFASRERREIGVAALMFTLMLSIRGTTAAGLSLPLLLAVCAVLYMARHGGILHGCLMGFAAGLAADPIYAPAVAAVGMGAGLFQKSAPWLSGAAGSALGLMTAVYTGGFSAIAAFLPELLGSCAVMIPALTVKILPCPGFLNRKSATADAAKDIAEERQKSASGRLKSLSETFFSLSELFYQLSDRLRRPSLPDIRRTVESAFETQCAECAMYGTCRGELCCADDTLAEEEFPELDFTEPNKKSPHLRGIFKEAVYPEAVEAADEEEDERILFRETVNAMAVTLRETGRLYPEDVPLILQKRCLRLDKLMGEINVRFAGQIKDAARTDKLEVFAIDYEAMAKLLANTDRENAADYLPDAALSEKLSSTFRELGLSAADLRIFAGGGGRRKLICAAGVDLRAAESAGLGEADIRAVAESVTGGHLSSPAFTVRDGGGVDMQLKSIRRFEASYTRCSSVMEGSEVNGDSISMFEGTGDRFYALISDGMGSGREAAMTSRVCALFLEKMLGCGADTPTSLAMLNSFVRVKNIECSATVDLFEMDLLTGEASFVKSGAAPSFVKRGDSIFRIQSKTVPIGLMRALDAESVKINLEAGDSVIMMSDGITQSFEDCAWLLDLMNSGWTENGDEMCRKIIDEAVLRNPHSDDMSVGIVRIEGVA